MKMYIIVIETIYLNPPDFHPDSPLISIHIDWDHLPLHPKVNDQLITVNSVR